MDENKINEAVPVVPLKKAGRPAKKPLGVQTAPVEAQEPETSIIESGPFAPINPPEEEIPLRVAPVTRLKRVAGKDYQMPIFHTKRFKNGSVGYGPEGQKVTALASTTEDVAKLNKFIATSNIYQDKKHSHDIAGLTPVGNPLIR